jgi:hypothetical protein
MTTALIMGQCTSILAPCKGGGAHEAATLSRRAVHVPLWRQMEPGSHALVTMVFARVLGHLPPLEERPRSARADQAGRDRAARPPVRRPGGRRAGPMAIAISRVQRCTRGPASSGRRSTGRAAVTSSTTPRRCQLCSIYQTLSLVYVGV